MVQTVPYVKEIIVVDDGSTDGSREAARRWIDRHCADIRIIHHPRNLGKGSAIRSAMSAARGFVTIIQDADLEYNVSDYPALIDPILSGEAEIVYGSRYLSPDAALPFTPNRLCVHLLNLLVWLLYGVKVTDEATCYKAFKTDILNKMDLKCRRFEFCPEVTAKAARMRKSIHEVAIRYEPRNHSQGKKIRWTDGLSAIATLCRWKFARLSVPSACGGGLPFPGQTPG